ncbi:MAG: DUF1573 domain-containing protein [Chitinophagaceae bacterium]|nr:DUF1573 domain-containing protein [Chitinophagaceae bacterium]
MKNSQSIFIFLIPFFISSCSNKNFKEHPIITAEKDIFNLGRIHKNDSVRLSFKIYNTGGDTLKVLNYGGGCGCTDIEVGKTKIFSGDSSSVNILYLPNQDIDSVYKSIVLETNAIERYKVIRLKAYVDTAANQDKIY